MRPRALGLVVVAVTSVGLTSWVPPAPAAVGLSLSVAAPAPMTLLPSTTSTTTSAATVAVTLGTWTMTIADTSTSTGAGRLKHGASATFLTQPLGWRVGSGAYQALSGTPAVVATGSLSGVTLIEFRQTTVAADPLALGDIWNLTANVVVS